MKTNLILIIISVALNALAQLFLKIGMKKIGHFEFSLPNFWSIGLRVSLEPYILGGIFFYIFSIFLWLLVLSRTEVSFAYPFLSLGYIFIAIMSYFFLSESIGLSRIIGICLICLGVIFIARS